MHSPVTFAIVEDEMIEQKGMSLFIQNTYPEARILWTASNGKSGYEKTMQNPPDILIIDIEMPVMNGLDLCEKLYHSNFSGVMLIHTAYAKFSYAKRAVALNVFDYILKPTDDEELKKTLERCIEEHERRRIAQEQQKDMQLIVQDVKQYALSLLTLRTLDTKQKELFFETVGWPKLHKLQSYVIRFTSPASFQSALIKDLEQRKAFLAENGFLLSSEYINNRSLLLIIQPASYMDISRLYTLIYLFLSDFSLSAPQISAAVRGYCSDINMLGEACSELARAVPKAGTLQKVPMPPRTWRIYKKKEAEKIEGTLNRYLRDGDVQRAKRLFDRICLTTDDNVQARFWEIVLICYDTVGKIWPYEAFTECFRTLFHPECTPQEWFSAFLSRCSKLEVSSENTALDSVLEWMQKSLACGDVSLSAAAERMGMDSAYFSRYFKKQMGKNFSDALTEIRLQHCEALLKEDPTLSLEELAAACGFSSKTYFCEVFKKWKGMTVTQYLKQA